MIIYVLQSIPHVCLFSWQGDWGDCGSECPVEGGKCEHPVIHLPGFQFKVLHSLFLGNSPQCDADTLYGDFYVSYTMNIPDVESCKTLCVADNKPFFSWISPVCTDCAGLSNGCTCRDSMGTPSSKLGMTSGDVTCVGE